MQLRMHIIEVLTLSLKKLKLEKKDKLITYSHIANR